MNMKPTIHRIRQARLAAKTKLVAVQHVWASNKKENNTAVTYDMREHIGYGDAIQPVVVRVHWVTCTVAAVE